MKYLLLIVWVLALPAYCQLVENTPFQQFREFPHAEIKNFGIGNYGFDPLENQYHPYYHENEFQPPDFRDDPFHETPHHLDSIANFYFSFRSNLNVAGGRNSLVSSENVEASSGFKNAAQIKPNLFAKYWLNAFLLHFSYTNDYQLSLKQDGDAVTYNFNFARVTADQQEVNISKSTLQLVASLLASPQLSLNLGLLTSRFDYTWDLGETNPVEYKAGLFKNFQYLFSISYQWSESFRYYLNFKSQKANFDLSEANLRLDNNVISLPIVFSSYYGNIGYGIQKSFWRRLKVSAEMRHQFLEVNDTTGVSNPLGGIDERHIWNNEIAIGANYQFSKRLKMGVLYTRFLKYDNLIYLRIIETEADGSEKLSIAHINKPASFILSGRYNLGKFILRGVYQYSGNEYKSGSRTILEDAIHFASVGFGYNFSL